MGMSLEGVFLRQPWTKFRSSGEFELATLVSSRFQRGRWGDDVNRNKVIL